ncbi:unnamed protein product [Cyprideis torosa]|uniref:Uncharacterized protein n=1 Tax=Cyprideis torosa TaxID=163714 RepID=A0A7R8ZQV7_9CRUS|nr:unnamed protein product [Cyprideis torosa]CAG0891570.1 unnamed protein product [Cyprideis torosa]
MDRYRYKNHELGNHGMEGQTGGEGGRTPDGRRVLRKSILMIQRLLRIRRRMWCPASSSTRRISPGCAAEGKRSSPSSPVTSEENWKNSRDQDNQLETATFPDLPAVMENYREIPEDIVKFLHSEQKLQEALRNLMFATQETVIPRLLEAHDHEQRALRNRKLNTLHKRGLDFGTNRGYAGSVAARYLMGLALANSPSGPGKK